MKITKPGIYAISEADYLADPAPEPSLSSSIASILCSSTPAHAKQRHPRLTERVEQDDAEHFDIGTLAHAILLEGVNAVEILDFKDFRTNDAKAARDAARAAGKVPLLRKVWADVEAMVNATRDQLDAHHDGIAMFRDGKPEQTLIWKEPNGIWCRARADYIRPLAIDDYKTTRRTANPDDLARSVFSNGWDIQAEFYRRGFHILTGRYADFRFAVQECFKPYALSVVALGPQAEMLAQKKVEYAIEIWAGCLKTNSWPSYPNRTAFVTLPPWVEADWVEREERDLGQTA